MTKEQIDQACDILKIETAMGRAALGIALDNIKLFDRKQQDYGSNNISKFGELGVLVRCSDKLERLSNLIQTKRAANNEPKEDSWKDLSNYGIIGQMLSRGEWK